MKKMGKVVAFFATAMLLMFGVMVTSCSSSSDSSGNSMKICLFGADNSKTWNIWAWKENGDNDINYDSKSFPGGSFQLTSTDTYGSTTYVYTTFDVDTSYPLGILFVASSGSPQTGDITVPISVLESTDTLYFAYTDMAYYTDIADALGIKSAEITSYSSTEIKITATVVGEASTSISDYSVKDSEENSLTVSSVSASGTTVTITITGTALSIANIPFTVTYNNASVYASVGSTLIDSCLVVSDDDIDTLGVTISGTNATFKTWAPLASKVSLRLFTSAPTSQNATATATFDMTKTTGDSWDGTWEYATGVSTGTYKYYQYAITNGSTTYNVADIWAFAASGDSIASEIISIDDSSCTPDSWESDYYNPWNNSTTSGTASEQLGYSDSVLYEMHVRDWAHAVSSSVTANEGSYAALTTALGESGTLSSHLKDLGITHVQILPFFDHAEKNADKNYNWGYNPYHYNAVEGRYATGAYTAGASLDGETPIKEVRAMIKAFHDAGIAVNMDVVYNHTSGTGSSSLYDMTVPGYFYNLDSSGSYVNGSGCGNEIASKHAMVKKYIIASLKHWMKDYHVNGFRFDLMGCLEADVMADIYSALYKIDKNVMVYGEPWTGGGTSGAEKGAMKADILSAQPSSLASGATGVSCFDDTYRDAIKGSDAFGFSTSGELQGTNNDSAITTGLLGSPSSAGVIGRFLNYAECHDNYTLYDKLLLSLGSGVTNDNSTSKYTSISSSLTDTQKAMLVSQEKLAAAYIFLAQGTPFINGGQEFCRTKLGDHNSYESSDTYNAIDLELKTTYAEVYNTYRGLIALRKANSSSFGANSSATPTALSTGVIKYTAGDFAVYFNATSSDYALTDVSGNLVTIDGTTKTEKGYTVATSSTNVTSVPARSFVILKN